MLPASQQSTMLIPADDHNHAQYANPMNDPFAEVEIGWRKMNTSNPALDASTSTSNEQVLHQLNQFSFAKTLPSVPKARKLSLPSPLLATKPEPNLAANMSLSMRRSDQVGLFRPPSSAAASKTSFSSNELSSFSHPSLQPSSRTRLSSFSTDLEPISASPTSPNSPYSFPSYDSSNKHQPNLAHHQSKHLPPSSRRSLPQSSWVPSSSSSSLSSDEERLLLRRASSSSIGSISSTSNSLKARRGLTKPLSLAVPNVGNHLANSAQALATPLRASYDPKLSSNSAFSRSLPPSPRLDDFGQARAQFVGMKANVTGGFSMKRRTSIPRLTLGASLGGANENMSSRARSSDPVRLIGRNYENSAMNTPVQLHFDPVAAGEGRRELMSSQAGVGGKGHIEVPSELTETFPYEHGPKEVLPDVYLGSEQNARDGNLLSSLGFGLIINVAKEVECPWEAATSPAPIENNPGWKKGCHQRRAQARGGLLVRPTASTPNLKRSFEGKIRVSLPNPTKNNEPRSIEMKHLEADCRTSRPSLDYIKLPWSHDQDGLASIFNDTEVFELIDKARERNLKTLVHCQCGVSRSATFVIGYCMREAVLFPHRFNLSGRMHDAYSFVKEKSPWAGPNMGLIYQLIEYEKVLFKKRGILEEEDDEMEGEEEEDTLREDIILEEEKKEDDLSEQEARHDIIVEDDDLSSDSVTRHVEPEPPLPQSPPPHR